VQRVHISTMLIRGLDRPPPEELNESWNLCTVAGCTHVVSEVINSVNSKE
jgi:hypothetical protein